MSRICRNMGRSGKNPVPLTRTCAEGAASQNSLPHLWTARLWSHKNAKKTVEGKSRRYDKANHRNKLPWTANVAGGGRDEERRLKENVDAIVRETNVKTSRGPPAWRGGEVESSRCYSDMQDARAGSPNRPVSGKMTSNSNPFLKKWFQINLSVDKSATSAYCRDKCPVATTVQQSIQSTLSISAY